MKKFYAHIFIKKDPLIEILRGYIEEDDSVPFEINLFKGSTIGKLTAFIVCNKNSSKFYYKLTVQNDFVKL